MEACQDRSHNLAIKSVEFLFLVGLVVSVTKPGGTLKKPEDVIKLSNFLPLEIEKLLITKVV